MKNLHFATILFSASLMLALPAATQASSRPALSAAPAASHRVEASIPFEFGAGSSVLPAGTYLFTFDPISQSGSIQGIGRPTKVVGLTNYVSNSEPKLQFKRDGKLMVLQGADAANSRPVSRRTGVAELQSATATAGGR